ncbi:MAG: hypothetical protein K9J17_08515 [Flavobacteriales bacterium]|nr:hypothetical protein [Flavobacteriales bacterium]
MEQFDPTSCFKLSDHSFEFGNSGLVIKDDSGKVVYSESYLQGFAIKAIAGDFCIGKMKSEKYFTVVLDSKNPKWGLKLITDGGTRILGSDEIGFPRIDQNEWEITKCPILIKQAKEGVAITCPCNQDGKPCSNSCYSVYQLKID